MLAALALQLLIVAAAPAREAVQLNTEGFRLYKRGELEPALAKFRQAAAADDQYALAHYNAAATMARILATDPCGGHDFDVLGTLARAIALDEGRRARSLKDPDFRKQRTTLAFRRLVLRPPVNQSLGALLEGTTFSSAAGWGSSGNSVDLRFLPGGKLLLGLRELRDDNSVVNVDHPGSWSVEGTTIRIRMSRAADKAYSGDAVFSPVDDSIEFPGLGKLVNYLGGACDA